MEINARVNNLLDPDTLNLAYKMINEIKVNKALSTEYDSSETDFELIERVIEVYELAIIDVWDYAFDTSDEGKEKKKELNNLCQECFNFMQVLPLPENDIDKAKHVLKLLTYAYLGEKWEDMRRYLKENEGLWKIRESKSADWDIRIFIEIYHAILYLIRKQSWEDLSIATKLIADLKKGQKEYEDAYLQNLKIEHKRGSAYELAALYHLARCVELVGQYMLQGTPNDVIEQLDLHFERCIGYSQRAGIIEMDLISRMLQHCFKKMVFNSIWEVTKRVNSRVTKFAELITKSNKPIFELLYPQRVAILEKGLLDAASKAVVVNLPTSSGKTIIAEFRILQALNQFSEEKGWIAYVAPTRALVNQITSRLRRDLGQPPLAIKVEKMSGALEIDSFEQSLIVPESSFNILVTTPEKLNLLIRQDIEGKLGRPLALVVMDEAHNLSDKLRGLNLEMLLSIIKKDCPKANLLLLTPFIPNSKEIARWLDPQNPRSISIELNWQPNDRVIGLCYAEGNRRDITAYYEPLITSQKTIELDKKIEIWKQKNSSYTLAKVQGANYILSALVGGKMVSSGCVLVLGRTVSDTWDMADILYETLPDRETDERIALVQKFIMAELGDEFPLAKLLNKRIGVHNAGLPEEVRELMEWLMENELLSVLVATTTIAQGMNFPVSTIVLASYAYPYTKAMPVRDFWNLVGRAGRIDQRSLGVIAIAVSKNDPVDRKKALEFVKKSTEELVSVLVGMVEQSARMGNQFSLEILASYPEWSIFLQYISHMYKQSQNLQHFISEVEITLRRTFGYNQLDRNKKQLLMQAVTDYAQKLDKKKHLATLSDMTGFSPETIQTTIHKLDTLGIRQSDWTSSRLFSNTPETLGKLVGIMLTDIPEIRNNLEVKVPGQKITHTVLSRIISDWVGGSDLIEIAKKYFGGSSRTAITSCVTAIYGKVAGSATWGLAALQKLPTSGIAFDKLSEDEKKRINNLPAMVFYGVNTDEAILMRINHVPRSISHRLGELYKEKRNTNTSIYDAKSIDVSSWLRSLDISEWNKAVPKTKKISGSDYKRVWEQISGFE